MQKPKPSTTSMKQIKKIGVLSLAKILGIIYAVMGLCIGIIITVSSLVMKTIPPEFADQPLFFGPLSIIIMPLLYGAIGFFGGIVGAFVYNEVAKRIGGIEIEF